MKKLLALVLTLALCLSFTACSSSDSSSSSESEEAVSSETTESTANTESTTTDNSDLADILANADGRLADILAAGKITIATEGDWSPWTYHDETTNELTGFDVELGNAIAEKLGVTAEFQETTWDAILSGVESGRFDLACNGVGYTDERAESYNFSDAYIYTKMVLMVQSDNEDITSFEDLAGKTTANSVGSTYATVAEGYGAIVNNVDTLDQTLELLVQGRIDATLNAEVSYLDYMNAHPDAQIKVVAKSEGEKVCIPAAKEDTDSLIAAVNAIIAEMREDGSLAELSEKYFNGDITNP